MVWDELLFTARITYTCYFCGMNFGSLNALWAQIALISIHFNRQYTLNLKQ